MTSRESASVVPILGGIAWLEYCVRPGRHLRPSPDVRTPLVRENTPLFNGSFELSNGLYAE